MSLREASGVPQAVGMAVWSSEDAVDSGLAATQAIAAAKAPMAEGCLGTGGSLAIQRLAELLGYMTVGRKLFPRGALGG